MIFFGRTHAYLTNTGAYRQGVILGGLWHMYVITANSSLLDLACSIANATTVYLTYPSGALSVLQVLPTLLNVVSLHTGILHEPCEPDCGGDGPQFKV